MPERAGLELNMKLHGKGVRRKQTSQIRIEASITQPQCCRGQELPKTDLISDERPEEITLKLPEKKGWANEGLDREKTVK